jgi:large subunit ribosomal protein L7/L12
MSEKLDSIIDSIAELSVLELSELIKALEEKFGVEAAAPMMMGAMPAAAGGDAGAADEEPTSFNVVLKDHGSQKIGVIKLVKDMAGLGLKEAKALVDGCPAPVKEGVDADEANKMKEELEGAGATVELEAAG